MKFKVGDQVKILDSAGSPVTVGSIGTIKRLHEMPSYPHYSIEVEGQLRAWYFRDEEVELIKDYSSLVTNNANYPSMLEMSESTVGEEMDKADGFLPPKEEFKMHYLLTKGSITLHYDGKTVVIAKDDERFSLVLEAIRNKKLADIPTIVEPKKYFESHGMEYEDGVIKARGEEMPSELADRIAAYKEHNLPFDSLLKFWDNLKLNPSFNSRNQLFKFLENKGHSLTEDGCFVGYRGVTEDFKDKHSKSFDNSPGKVCEVARKDVDDNPNNTCSFGLHVGGYEYAKDFGKGGKLVLVKVNPQDVVAVPNDYNGQKMRVCKFEVVEEVSDMNKEVIFGNGIQDSEFDEDELYDNEDEDGINDTDIDAVLDARDSILENAETNLNEKIARECPWLTKDQIQEILDSN